MVLRCVQIELQKKCFASSRELFAVVLTYIKLELKRVLLVDMMKRPITTDRVLGLSVSFSNFAVFVELFRDIFLFNSYCFSARTSSPFVIDCGSNIGMATLFFKRRYPDCQVIAFEPDSRAFELLERNVKANNMTDVQLEKAALSSSEGTTDLYYDPNQAYSLRTSTRIRMLARPSPGHERVRTVLLSSFIDKEVDLLKMDVEGDEQAILEDLDRSQKIALVREMIIEYHHHIEKREDKLSSFLGILEANNFGYQITSEDRLYSSKQTYQSVFIFAYRKGE
jgi:FkbM family methyltransferase